MTPQPRKPRRIQIFDPVEPTSGLSNLSNIDPAVLKAEPHDLGVTADEIIFQRNLIRRVGREQIKLLMHDLLHER